MMIVDIKSLCLQKRCYFLISALKSSEKGVGVIYQLYNFILNTTITQNNFNQLIFANLHIENNTFVSC